MLRHKQRLLTRVCATILLVGSWASTQAGEVPAGAGSFTTDKPSHRWQPSTAEGYDQTVPEGQPWGIYTPRKNQTPFVTNHFKSLAKPTPTHEFWSSAMWKFAVKNLIRDENGGVRETNTDTVPYSHWMTNSPFTMKFTNRGVNLTYAQQPLLVPYRYEDPNSSKRVLPSVTAPQFTAYTYPARIDPSLDPLGGTEFNVQFDGLNADKTLLDDYSDFSGTILLKNPGTSEVSNNVKVTMTNGSPFLHFEKNGLGNVTFTYFNGMRIIHESNGTLALYLGDVRTGYAIFAPKGTQFSYTLMNLDLKELTARGKITMTLPAGRRHFSVGILPNEINDIFKAPTQYTEQGFVVQKNASVNQLPTHIEGTHSPLVVARLVGDFFREDKANDGVGVEELDTLILDYRKHAFALPVKTTFDSQYNEASSKVVSSFNVDTQLTESDVEPSLVNMTMMGLYRHQYLNTRNLNFAYTYSTPRGVMKVIKANNFETQVAHVGLIPNLPNTLKGAELTRLLTLLNTDKNGQWVDGLMQNDVLDTYNNGKELNWIVQLLHIAQQTGETATAQLLMNKIKVTLEDWLDASDWQQDKAYNNSQCELMVEPSRGNCYRDMRLANERKYFYYNQEWSSLTGFPASFGSDTELNDHHFHVGYLVSAAAAVARYDKAWAQRWKPMVDLLIKDSANWDRQDGRFQYLRYFDIYNGYSIANGHLNMDAGGNQESSSESINFAQAVAFWGSETGDNKIRDLGIALYSSEIQAIEQYWFDVDNAVFPKGVYWDNGSQFVKKDFDRASVGLVWHSKADYGTWFSAAPRMIAGINFLPITGASLYLGRMERQLNNGSKTPSVQLIMDRLEENTRFFAQEMYHRPLPVQYQQYDFRRKTRFWDDLMWEAEALVNPQAAAAKFEAAGNYVREFDPSLPPLYPNDEVRGEAGESKTHTYHWIYNLNTLGKPVKNITADTPHFAVFEKNGSLNRVAYNPTATSKIVNFSDGVSIQLEPGQLSGGVSISSKSSSSSVSSSSSSKSSISSVSSSSSSKSSSSSVSSSSSSKSSSSSVSSSSSSKSSSSSVSSSSSSKSSSSSVSSSSSSKSSSSSVSSSSSSKSSSSSSSSSVMPPNCRIANGFNICQESKSGGNLVVTVNGANGWAIIHNGQGNFQMAAGVAAGQYVYTFSNMSNGANVNAWFTINGMVGATDTSSLNFVYNSVFVPSVSNLRVSSLSETEVNATWAAPIIVGVSVDYRVKLMRGTTLVQSVASTAGQTHITFTALTAGTDYRIEVETLAVGNNSAAASLDFKTPGQKVVVCNKQPKDVCTDTIAGGLRVSVYGASGWAIIHYAAGNFQMKAGAQGEYYYDIPNVPVGTTVNAWFTVNTLTGAYDSANYVLAHP